MASGAGGVSFASSSERRAKAVSSVLSLPFSAAEVFLLAPRTVRSAFSHTEPGGPCHRGFTKQTDDETVGGTPANSARPSSGKEAAACPERRRRARKQQRSKRSKGLKSVLSSANLQDVYTEPGGPCRRDKSAILPSLSVFIRVHLPALSLPALPTAGRLRQACRMGGSTYCGWIWRMK